MKRWKKVLWVIAGGCLLAACKPEDRTPLDTNFSAETPHIAGLSVTVDSLDTGNLPPSSRAPDDSVLLTGLLRLVLSADTPPVSIASVTVKIYGPDGAVLQLSTIANDGAAPDLVAGDSVYTGFLRLKILRKHVGTYTVRLTALNTDGNSDTKVRSFDIINSSNHRPAVSNLDAPDTVRKPPKDSIYAYLFSIHASDAEGLSDIVRVSVDVIDSSGKFTGQFQLFDDGNIPVDGDSVANDGTYSRIFKTDSTTTVPNRNTFLFYAVDRSGSVSDTLRQIIVNQ